MTSQLMRSTTTAVPPATIRSRSAMLGVTVIVGPVVGGVLGALTFFAISGLAFLADGTLDGSTLIALAFYSLWAVGVGAVVGLVQALVSLAAVLVLRAERNLTAARVVGALGASLLPLLAATGGSIPAIVVPFTVASAASAACLMRVITRARARVGL
ncbi:MAG: hypothetical protein JWO46_2542 [Nocardioidaceae bacterium]|nr:hypothetical protein [Nocardioidaceae bacterium]